MGLELPDAAREVLAASIEVLRGRVPDARWVPAQNLHVTLAFLGVVDEDSIPLLLAALEEAAENLVAHRAGLGELGAFPSMRRARVLWAGLEDPAAAAASAAEAVAVALEPLGFRRERRAFSPHVTLARLRAPARVDLGDVSVPSVPVPIEAVTVFSSRLGGSVPRYEVISRVELGPDRGS